MTYGTIYIGMYSSSPLDVVSANVLRSMGGLCGLGDASGIAARCVAQMSVDEISYRGYARQRLRSADLVTCRDSGWHVCHDVGLEAERTIRIQFPTCPDKGWQYASYWAAGPEPTGHGSLVFGGQISPSIFIGNGVTPLLLFDADVWNVALGGLAPAPPARAAVALEPLYEGLTRAQCLQKYQEIQRELISPDVELTPLQRRIAREAWADELRRRKGA